MWYLTRKCLLFMRIYSGIYKLCCYLLCGLHIQNRYCIFAAGSWCAWLFVTVRMKTAKTYSLFLFPCLGVDAIYHICGLYCLALAVGLVTVVGLSLSNSKGIAGILVWVNRGLCVSFWVYPFMKRTGIMRYILILGEYLICKVHQRPPPRSVSALQRMRTTNELQNNESKNNIKLL